MKLLKRLSFNLSKIFIALGFALWLEFFYKFGATSDIANFIGSIPIYLIYLTFLNIFLSIAKLKKKAFTCFTVFGSIGLIAEWFLIGNSPWKNPDASQIAMFIFHAIYPLIGLIYFKNQNYVQSFSFNIRLFALFTLIGLLGFLIPSVEWRFAWFIWIPLFPYFISAGNFIYKIKPKYLFNR